MEAITEKAWVTELDRIVRGPAWPHVRAWFMSVLVKRVLTAEDPLGAAAIAAGELEGASALMLAIENEVATKSEAIDGRRFRTANARPEDKQRRINGISGVEAERRGA